MYQIYIHIEIIFYIREKYYKNKNVIFVKNEKIEYYIGYFV